MACTIGRQRCPSRHRPNVLNLAPLRSWLANRWASNTLGNTRAPILRECHRKKKTLSHTRATILRVGYRKCEKHNRTQKSGRPRPHLLTGEGGWGKIGARPPRNPERTQKLQRALTSHFEHFRSCNVGTCVRHNPTNSPILKILRPLTLSNAFPPS